MSHQTNDFQLEAYEEVYIDSKIRYMVKKCHQTDFSITLGNNIFFHFMLNGIFQLILDRFSRANSENEGLNALVLIFMKPDLWTPMYVVYMYT